MDLNTVHDKIVDHARAGEFFQALELIKTTQLVSEGALNILVAAANACYYNPDECNLDVIQKFIRAVVSSIDTLNEATVTPYFQSIFHIIKLMCKKERFEDLSKMDYAINPNFLENSLLCLKNVEEATHTCLMVIKQISVSVSQLAQNKNSSYNTYLLDIYKIILKAQNKLSTPEDLLSLAQTSFNQLHHLEATSDILQTFYIIVLKELAAHFGKANEYSDAILLLLMPIFSDILTNIIQSGNFEFATTFVDVIDSRVRSNFKQIEFEQSHEIFKTVTALFAADKDLMKANMDKAKTLLHTFKTSHKELFYNIICLVEQPLLQLLSCYRNSSLELWCKLPNSIIVNILKFLMDEITCYSHLLSKKCTCGCSITKNYCSRLKIGCQMAAILKSYLEQLSNAQMKNLNEEFFGQLEKWLKFFYSIIKKLKTGGCQKWTIFYSDLASHTYNICVVLYKSQNKVPKGIALCFLKNSLELEGTQPEIRPVHTNTFAFSGLCEIEANNKNWSGCMGLTALHCLLYPQNSNTIFVNWWITPKIKAKEDRDFQQQTLLSVLSKQSKQLSYIFDVETLLTTERKIQLLTFELTRYRAAWSSKVSMMATFKHLSEIADISTMTEVMLQIYGDGEVSVHTDLSSVLLILIKSIEDFLVRRNDNPNMTLALAVLYFYYFKTSFKETTEKNIEEMETKQVLESARKGKTTESVPRDTNDECDIVTAYSNLRLNKFVEILESLNSSLNHISTVVESTIKSNICKTISKLLINIGLEYRLHCFGIKSLQAFEMSRKLAQRISYSKGHLFSLSFMVQAIDVQQESAQELIREGDKVADQLKLENVNGRYSTTLATYYLSKSKAFLYEDAKQSYEAWQAADAICKANDTKGEFQILLSELYAVLYKLTKNCDFIKEEHEREPMTLKLHCAYNIILEKVENNLASTYELCVLFDTVYEVAKVYHLMRLPRDLRAYSKNAVLLTQKMVLPVRCVSFLILLAHSDILTCKFDDCNVKLNGINDILCLRDSPNEKSEMQVDVNKAENEVDRCPRFIEGLVLEVLQGTRQYSPGSPALAVERFKFPQFMSHEKNCMCFMCLSLEIQRLFLEKYHLNAVLNMHEKEDKTAEDFIGGALALYESFNKNYDNYIAKASKLVPASFILDFMHHFLEPYANILLDYSYHMARKPLMSEAIKITNKLLLILKPKKFRYPQLYKEVLMQGLSYIVPNTNEVPSENRLETQMGAMRLTPSDNAASLARTPTSKTSTVTVMGSGVPSYSPPRRKVKKINLFGGDKNSDLFKKSPITKNKRLAPKVEAAAATPFFGPFEIPKIKIFTDEEPAKSSKTSSRKRVASVKKQAEGSASKPDNTKTKNNAPDTCAKGSSTKSTGAIRKSPRNRKL